MTRGTPESSVAGRVAAFMAAQPTDGCDALWMASAGLLEMAAQRARDALHGRLHSYPAGELRRLEEAVAHALTAARFAVELRQAESDDWHEATRELRERAADAATAARRRQTLPAQQARLAKAAARRAVLSDQAATVDDTHC